MTRGVLMTFPCLLLALALVLALAAASPLRRVKTIEPVHVHRFGAVGAGHSALGAPLSLDSTGGTIDADSGIGIDMGMGADTCMDIGTYMGMGIDTGVGSMGRRGGRSTRLFMAPGGAEVEVAGRGGQAQGVQGQRGQGQTQTQGQVGDGWLPTRGVPPPLDNLVDVALERRAVVYEAQLGRDLGFEIVEGPRSALVGVVAEGSKAARMGIRQGDAVVATSATAGELMWTHDSAEGVKSALSTRFVMSNTVKIRFERRLDLIDPQLVSVLRVPFYSTVKLKRPIGLHVVEGPSKAVYVQFIKPNLGASRSRRVEVGDQIVAMSASWGDRLWEVHSVDSFVMGVKMRTDTHLTFRLKRLVPLQVYAGQSAPSTVTGATATGTLGEMGTVSGTAVGEDKSRNRDLQDQQEEEEYLAKLSLSQRIGRVKSANELKQLLQQIKEYHLPRQSASRGSEALTEFQANKFMSLALQLEQPQLAVDLFESAFGFKGDENNARDVLQLFKDGEREEVQWADMPPATKPPPFPTATTPFPTAPAPAPASVPAPSAASEEGGREEGRSVGAGGAVGAGAYKDEGEVREHLRANNFVCTTAVKAYGRLRGTDKAMAVLPWLEGQGCTADAYLMSALLYVLAKSKRVREAEYIFWQDMPSRNLTYSAATVNSLMYMYARLNRPDDALRVYELMKDMGLKCTVVTYGVLIKALMRSAKKPLQETAFEILRSLPNLGIHPGAEVYNQIFEYYATTHDYRQTKAVLRLMASAKPRVKLDAVSYGHLIQCFADAKKPRSALSAFRQMRNQGIAPSLHTYMGVLKALGHMRDGVSAVQVLQEMRDVGVTPDRRHHAMAMFACVTSNQCALAESIVTDLREMDAVLCTLWLRALLQQGKWTEGADLLAKMEKGREFPKPNQQTFNCLLQYQIMDHQWAAATDTLSSILRRYSATLTRIGMDGSMAGTFSALSFALGKYSSAVSRRYREDSAMGLVPYGVGTGAEITITGERVSVSVSGGVGGGVEGGVEGGMGGGVGGGGEEGGESEDGDIDSAEGLFGINSDSDKTPATATTPTPASGVGAGASVDASVGIVGSVGGAGVRGKESEVMGGALYLEGRLSRPDPKALTFAVRSLALIGQSDNIFVQGEFYIELLKALILEGQADLAEELLDLKGSGGVRLKTEDNAQLSNIESLARRAISSGLIVPKA